MKYHRAIRVLDYLNYQLQVVDPIHTKLMFIYVSTDLPKALSH